MPFYDAFWSITIGSSALLAVIALVQVVGCRDSLNRGWAAIWVVVVLIAPVMGAIMWFLVGRRTTSSNGEAAAQTQLARTNRDV
jgi:hypothetical protein